VADTTNCEVCGERMEKPEPGTPFSKVYEHRHKDLADCIIYVRTLANTAIERIDDIISSNELYTGL
jgi:hypothetical protein